MRDRITLSDLEAIKHLAPYLLESYEQGAIILTSDREVINANYSSEKLNISAFQKNEAVSKYEWIVECLNTGKTIRRDISRSTYGTRLQINVFPVFIDNNQPELVGTLSVILPMEPVLARAFPDFAPMLAEMFPEGAFIYITGRNHVSHRQSSARFDLPDLQLRAPIKEGDIASETLKSGKPVVRELDASAYGVPVMMLSYPIVEPRGNGRIKITGTFGIALPKAASYKLRDMADRLDFAMQQIGQVVQQLAELATEVATNSQKTNRDMKDIHVISERINEVLSLIKNIADETKMLGLNAAIEAARAGDSGRGFGVVAAEIRKLSDESRQTVLEIKALTQKIEEKLNEGTVSASVLLQSSEEQAAGAQQLNASVQQILALIQEIESISRIV